MARYLSLASFFLLNGFAQDLSVAPGISDYRVFQRSAGGSASIQLNGSSAAEGRNVEARVTKKGLALKALNWRTIGKVDGGKWAGRLDPVPTGGPYNIELRVAGKARLRPSSHRPRFSPRLASIDDTGAGREGRRNRPACTYHRPPPASKWRGSRLLHWVGPRLKR